MPFPATNRVIYERNVLAQVVCQLRFPPILRIETQLPVDFQEVVRLQFPEFSEKVETPITQLPANLQEMIPETLRARFQGRAAYEFKSSDEEWSLSLTREFLALSTSKYTGWTEFQERLRIPLGALIDIYKPGRFSRIGLRYQNVIRRSELGLSDVAWSELVSPNIACVLANPITEPLVLEYQTVMLLSLSDQIGQVRIQHGLAKSETENDAEPFYLLDNDFFTTTPTEVGDELRILTSFNDNASRLFRWCIGGRLHEAMGPRVPANNGG